MVSQYNWSLFEDRLGKLNQHWTSRSNNWENNLFERLYATRWILHHWNKPVLEDRKQFLLDFGVLYCISSFIRILMLGWNFNQIFQFCCRKTDKSNSVILKKVHTKHYVNMFAINTHKHTHSGAQTHFFNHAHSGF